MAALAHPARLAERGHSENFIFLDGNGLPFHRAHLVGALARLRDEAGCDDFDEFFNSTAPEDLVLDIQARILAGYLEGSYRRIY